MSTADNGSHGAFPNPEAKNCYARNLVSDVAMIWFVCPRPCVFQLSTWFQEAGKVPLYTRALLGQVKGLERVLLMMPSTVLVSYEGGGYANAQWWYVQGWIGQKTIQSGCSKRLCRGGRGQVCEVPENLQDSSSWFTKIAGDMIIMTAAPVDWRQILSKERYPLPSPPFTNHAFLGTAAPGCDLWSKLYSSEPPQNEADGTWCRGMIGAYELIFFFAFLAIIGCMSAKAG